MAIILHISDQQSWDQARATGSLRPASLDTEGFVHCSTVRQAVDTANLFFAGQRGLILVCIDEARCKAEVKWEPPTAATHDPDVGALFPHIYGPVDVDAVVEVVPFPPGPDGAFALPERVDAVAREHGAASAGA